MRRRLDGLAARLAKMIKLYAYRTGQCQRASIALEECGLAYLVHAVDIAKGEQHSPVFRKINPFGTVPVIVDSDGPDGRSITISQSGAILLYCAQKSGKLLPNDPLKRISALQWAMFGLTDGSDPLGGIIRLTMLTDKPERAIEFFSMRLRMIWEGVDTHLADHEYLAEEFSIADIALYPIVVKGMEFVDIAGLDKLQRWLRTLSTRPAVARGMAV